jgi:hypothetical protein
MERRARTVRSLASKFPVSKKSADRFPTATETPFHAKAWRRKDFAFARGEGVGFPLPLGLFTPSREMIRNFAFPFR